MSRRNRQSHVRWIGWLLILAFISFPSNQPALAQRQTSSQVGELERRLEAANQDLSKRLTVLEIQQEAGEKEREHLFVLTLGLFGVLFAALIAFYVRERRETQHLQRVAELEKQDFNARLSQEKTAAATAIENLKADVVAVAKRAAADIESLREGVLAGLRSQMDLLVQKSAEQSAQQRQDLLDTLPDEIAHEASDRLQSLLDQYSDAVAKLGGAAIPVDYVLRAQFHLLQGDLASLNLAEQEALRATELDSSYLDGWIALARARKRLGRLPAARDALVQANAVDPANTAVLRELVSIDLQLFNNQDALQWLERLQALPETDTAWLRTNLAVALRRTGRPLDAVKMLNNCLASNPRHSPARYELLEMLLDEGVFRRALDVASEGLAINADDAGLFVLRARAQHGLGEARAALDDLIEAERRNPHDVKIYVTRGRMLSEKGDLPEAIEAYRKGLALRGPRGLRAVLKIGLANAYGRSGNTADAVKEAQEAVELGPTYSINYSVLIQWLFQNGQPEEGVVAARQGIAQVPSTAFRGVILFLGALCASMLPPTNSDTEQIRKQFLSQPVDERRKIRWDIGPLRSYIENASPPPADLARLNEVLNAIT